MENITKVTISIGGCTNEHSLLPYHEIFLLNNEKNDQAYVVLNCKGHMT